MDYSAARALTLLRQGCALAGAEFRDGQEAAIRQVVERRGRLLVVQKTGWGKSFVYFIACKLLREAGSGPALLVSPLLSLMRNQLLAAERMGVQAATINSGNQPEWADVEARLDRDEVDILLISPERLGNQRFRKTILSVIAARVCMLVIDEAHCISDWGHDFRPHYRLIERIVRNLPTNLPLLATTATANGRVMADLAQVLGPDIDVSRGDLNRPSLQLQTIVMPNQAQRLAWLAETLARLPGSGIIYALTVRDAHRVAEWLQHKGFEVAAYTGQSGDARPALEDALLDNRVKALVATTALGMGYDKPDIGFVIHYQTPGSVVAYYQQVGRAGRALDGAYGVLLSGSEDTAITDYFIERAFPTHEEVRQVLSALESNATGLSIPQLTAAVNLSRGRIATTIDLLSLESPAPIVQTGSQWQLTTVELSQAFWERAERLTRLRRDEQRQMQEYASLSDGHMEYLIRALDGDPERLQTPALTPLPTSVSEATVREAVAFLRRTCLPIEPRKKWPHGGLPRYGLRGNIATSHRAERGLALCVWRDSGWGDEVYRGKYEVGRFSDDLVVALASMVRDNELRPAPEWVTCLPSLRHPELVPGLARRLAQEVGLPFREVLTKADGRPLQKTMQNSTQQARNLDGALLVSGKVPSQPVLLVDDMVDSRWTLTVAAWLLRSSGSGAVYPVALAVTSGADD